MKGVLRCGRCGELDRSGEGLRKGRWHVGHSEPELGVDTPRSMSCCVWGSRTTIASLCRLDMHIS